MTDNPYDNLRRMALAIDPADVVVAPGQELPHVFGVVMDMGMNSGTATLVALADGTVSMYYSSGGGMIGAGEHEQVRNAAHRLLAIAGSDQASFTAGVPDVLPAGGSNQLTLLTVDGPLRATATSEDFGYDHVPGGLVFRAVHDVISQLRELDP